MKQNNEIIKDFSVIILAAGNSERIGFPKLSLKYDENTTFIEHIVKEYIQFGCEEIVLVVNEIGNKYLVDHDIRFEHNVKVVINKHPDWHRFYSLKIGVKSLSEAKSCFIHNVDNPFVNYNVLNELYNNLSNTVYISPVFEGKGGHPILLSKNIISDLKFVEEDQMHFKEFLNKYSKQEVKVNDKMILVNINTIEEYEKFFD